MSVTPERLEEKRRRADQLRQEIATLQYVGQENNAQADLALQDAALDEELERLDRERRDAMRNAGGSVADALAAMEAAEAAQSAEEAAKAEMAENRPPVVIPAVPAEKEPVGDGAAFVRPNLAGDNKTEGEGSK